MMSLPDYSHPRLQYDVEDPERLSRLLLFLKPFMAIPHVIVLFFLYIAVFVVTTIAWFAILITGRYPRGMWEFTMGVMRWSANVTAYATTFQRDEYPPFSGTGDYPVTFDMEYPDTLSRLMIFIKWLLAIPHFIVLYFLGIAANIVVFVSWIVVLITGHYPESLFKFIVGVYRWSYRVSVYTMLLTDDYPPFSFDEPNAGPAGPAIGAAPTPPPIGESQF